MATCYGPPPTMPSTKRLLLATAATLALTGCKKAEEPPPGESSPPTSSADARPAGRTGPVEIPAATCPELTRKTAEQFLALSLSCVDREYPNKPSNTLGSAADVRSPRAMTPAFYGCYDWHSAVHGHWAMTRIIKRFPDAAGAAEAKKKLLAHITPANITVEIEHFQKEHQVTFERPYGWGWLLRLAEELETWDEPAAKRLRDNLRPLSDLLAKRTADYLGKLSVPVRAGTHNSTAFALVHMLDYARAVGDSELEAAIVQRSRDFYLQDRSCPIAYEPSGEDFISPCFAEADLMRRVLSKDEFRTWFRDFMPAVSSDEFKPLLTPIEVRDRKDPKIGHLIGLAFQRAWAMAGVARSFDQSDPAQEAYEQLANLYCQDAYRQMFDSGYGGAHWLASFAIYHLSGVGRDGAGPNQAPENPPAGRK